MKIYATIIAVSVILFGLSGCANQPYSQNQNGGAVIGGILGGVLGNQVGHGRGRTAATIIGTIGGAALGSNVGQSMDDVNRMKAQQYQSQSQYRQY
ncbi:MAG: glycine zipper 2TM domain-containing protein, partial [Methylococcales bacterium]|nr:glycine zipper 2TM domain-containing protein [Methylococcales bacterium]